MSTAQSPAPRCGACPIRKPGERLCQNENGKHPPDCPTANKRELIARTMELYRDALPAAIMQKSAAAEREGYSPHPDNKVLQPKHPRVVEIVNFAQHMGYNKIGLIFCFGLREEAAIVNQILETNGLNVVSAICKVGNVPKAAVAINPEHQFNPSAPEAMCNPILQAELMNDAAVDFNILFGLCVGHDTLALRYAKAPATVLAVKDRVHAHDPLACLHTYNSYASYLKEPIFCNRKLGEG